MRVMMATTLGLVAFAIVSAIGLLFACAIWADVKIMRIEISKLIEELSDKKKEE